MSLIKTKNNKGPRIIIIIIIIIISIFKEDNVFSIIASLPGMDPCGTPALIYARSDKAPESTTRCRLWRDNF